MRNTCGTTKLIWEIDVSKAREEIGKLVQEARDLEASHRNRAATDIVQADMYADLFKTMKRAVNGKRWVDVDRVDLVIGRFYVARRSYVGAKCKAALAQWTEHGWREKIGKIPVCSAKGSTVEVFV